ncbi:hypothetical protein D3C81_1430420 [compost metagenome]
MPAETYFLSNIRRRVAIQKDAVRKNVIYLRQISLVPDNNNQLRDNDTATMSAGPSLACLLECTSGHAHKGRITGSNINRITNGQRTARRSHAF